MTFRRNWFVSMQSHWLYEFLPQPQGATMQTASTKLSLFLVAATLFGTGSLQAQTAADVPAGLNGTYDLKLDFISSNIANFPHKKDDVVRFVIDAAKDTLCLNGTLLTSKPVMNSVGNTFTWISNTNTHYEVVLRNNALYEVNAMQGTASNFAGQFTGSKISNAVDCIGAVTTTITTTPTITTDVQSIFDLAAQVYPTLLVNGSAPGLYQGYTYKFFASSGIYVGIKDNKIFTMGGPFGTAIKEQGTVSLVLNALQTAKAKIDAAKPTTPVTPTTPVIPAGLYTLKVTGNVNTSFGVGTALNFTLQNMPAPNVSDTTVIIDQVKSQLAGVGGISNIRVTSINNAASRVTFRVEFSATMSGLSVTYDLSYDYTK